MRHTQPATTDAEIETTLHAAIARTSRRRPELTAVISGDRRVSYGELNARANDMARRLRGAGVRRGDTVVVCMPRCAALPAVLLGVMKTGAAYVPIDPAYPAARRDFIIADCGAVCAVADDDMTDLSGVAVPVVRTDAGLRTETPSEHGDADDLDESAGPAALACIIYTSGSTGRPKGVRLNHRGRINNFRDFNARFGVGPGDSLLSVSSVGFDMSAYDIFGTLMSGATLVFPQSRDGDISEWASLLGLHGVTIWHSVPSLLNVVVQYLGGRSLESLRVVLLGGDWIPLSLVPAVRRTFPRSRFISLGGVTEVSMDSTIYEVDAVDPSWVSIPCGVAMTGQRAYVLDDLFTRAAVGVSGELYFGGVGVADGYHKRPALTAQRFVPDALSSVPGARLYRTGDAARYHDSGDIEFLGRLDFQVKVRGVRIELGEIEAAVARHPAVERCVAVAVGPAHALQGVQVYVETRATVTGAELLAFARQQLPATMVPSACVILAAFPLTAHGKVDRTALAAQAAAAQ